MLNRLSWENRNRRSFPIFHGKWFRLPTQHTHTSTMVVDGTRQWTRTKKTSGRRTISTFSGRGFPFDKAPALTTVGRCDSEGFAVTTYCRVCGSADSRSSGAINQPTLSSKKQAGEFVWLTGSLFLYLSRVIYRLHSRTIAAGHDDSIIHLSIVPLSLPGGLTAVTKSSEGVICRPPPRARVNFIELLLCPLCLIGWAFAIISFNDHLKEDIFIDKSLQ